MPRPVLPVVILATLLPAQTGCHAGPMHGHDVHWELASDPARAPMELREGHAIVRVTIDGKGPYPFVFDTGAQGCVMDLAFAKELGLALGEEVGVGSPAGGKPLPGHFVSAGTMMLGGLTLHDVPLVAFEGLPFQGDDPARGVLGPYALSGLLVTLDYPAKQFVFASGSLPEPDGREVFGWDRSHRLPEIDVTVGGLPARVHLDTGSTGALSLPTEFADRLEMDGPLTDMGYARAVDTAMAIQGGRIRGSLQLGRYTLDSPTVRFMDMAKGVGNVGSLILGQMALTIDPANSRLRLAGPPDGRITEAAGRKRYGIRLADLAATPLRVEGVDAGSAAAAGGLLAGDEILEMAGRPVDGMDDRARVDALRGSPLVLKVKRSDRTIDLTLTLD